MIIPTLLYASDSFIFYNALKNEGMAIMNLVWNLISNISVSLIGIVYFKEIISPFKILGMLLSIVSILLMTYSG
jgi:multidrug transporter EmrE-like cation transporter